MWQNFHCVWYIDVCQVFEGSSDSESSKSDDESDERDDVPEKREEKEEEENKKEEEEVIGEEEYGRVVHDLIQIWDWIHQTFVLYCLP